MDKLFNSIVLVALATTVIFWVIPVIDHLWLSEQELRLLSVSGWQSILPNNQFTYWSMLTLWIVVSVGLIMRIRIFRTIYLISLVTTIIANFLWGYLVLSPIEASISNILGILDGVILTMAYFTSVGTTFSPGYKNVE